MSNGEGKNVFQNSKLFQKIKGVKHLEIVAIVVLFAIALLVYFSFFSNKSKSETSVVESGVKTDMAAYTSQLEKRLEDVLTGIKDAGKVSVMITFDGSPKYVFATNDDTKTNTVSNGSTSTSTSQTSSSPILVKIDGKEQALICEEILPPIKGVLIVSSGAEDVNVRLELLKATQTILCVPTSSIEILVGNKN